MTAASGNPSTALLEWHPSTDNVGVAGYYVFRNEAHVGTTPVAVFQDSGLARGTTYSYVIKAFDFAGNVSAPSLTVHATTK